MSDGGGASLRRRDRQCEALREVGESCESSADCASANCGALPGTTATICFDRAGGSCSDATCGSCDGLPGQEVCAQVCRYSSCGQDAGCYGSVDGGYYCRASCNSRGCPPGFSCELANDPGHPLDQWCFPD